MRLGSEKNISDEPHERERECSERAESGEQRKLLIMFVSAVGGVAEPNLSL